MDVLTIALGAALFITLALLVQSLFRQAKIQDTMKETEESAKGQLKLWEELGQHLDEGIALLDEHQAIVYANHPFATMTGWPNRAAFHQRIDQVLQLQNESAQSVSLAVGDGRETVFVIGKDNRRTPVHAAKRALARPDGYTVVILRDATAENAEDELRQRLVNLSSFELRAPATAIKGYASMLDSGDAGKLSKAAKEYLKPIVDSAETLIALIDDIAHIEVLSSKKMPIKTKRIPVSEFLKQWEPRLADVAKQNGHSLQFGEGNFASEVEVDSDSIGRVLVMLTNTAARTAKQGSPVALRIQEAPRTVDILLENQGSPLPKQRQANVFDYVGGQGLEEGVGFYVAKQIIEAHHAYVTVNANGDGNVFILSLPKIGEASNAPAPKAKPAKKDKVDKTPKAPKAPATDPESDKELLEGVADLATPAKTSGSVKSDVRQRPS